MNNLDRASVKSKNRKRRALVTTVILVILIIGLFFRNQAATVAHYTLIPVNTSFHYISKPFSSFFNYFSSKTKLEQENYELRDRNKVLEIEILSMKVIKDQNNELRQIVGLKKLEKNSKITGQVIVTPPFSPFDTFVVKISDERITEENKVELISKPVFVKNTLVGEVSEIYNKNIIVKMLSSFGNKTSVKINNEIIAEAEGQGGLSFKIVIPKDVKVEVGMPIFSMDQPETIIGAIKEIDVTEASSFQTLYFQYMFTFSNFNFVEIAI